MYDSVSHSVWPTAGLANSAGVVAASTPSTTVVVLGPGPASSTSAKNAAPSRLAAHVDCGAAVKNRTLTSTAVPASASTVYVMVV